MKNLGQTSIRDLLFLSFAAGNADAAGYLGLGHVFTSNMTGNLVLLGIDLGEGRLHEAGRASFAVVLFILGVGLGALIGQRIDEKDWCRLVLRVIGLEAALLALFAFLWVFLVVHRHTTHFHVVVAPLAIAMGLQSETLNRLTIAGVTNTALTGTLTSLVGGMTRRFLTRRGDIASIDPPPSRTRVQSQALVLILYGAGAILSAVLIQAARWTAGFVPVLLVGAVVMFHLFRERNKPRT